MAVLGAGVRVKLLFLLPSCSIDIVETDPAARVNSKYVCYSRQEEFVKRHRHLFTGCRSGNLET
jgi:hypothetical protein